ncbi:isoprenyl transferase [Agrobacterium vitis]|uniref:Isoprenyl transferase n=1 Tax=Agrobacterium vitis TaxID=373 RepID=A0ABD6G9Y3_AGRVI|nr:isoprenyl transferase [Agrobacterium vitis]MUO77745.1 isoprenyl transferase [Agrobacterium vitis]MUO93262.1 isoprenyl transferase [Agrobacterium vitis]MUP04613.1 isoprenyl transferase [Agrobacterium vitis]MUZ80950.1 isoprenyl transferase [Agrobacterium vitis]MVA08865.1 isoprenyl transferase [Agrobacterium vitis]
MTTLDISAVPEHVAIIMDGNGRWANQRGMPRAYGHRQGMEALQTVVRTAGEIGVRYLTLFAFSSENWRRPETEITDLFGLLKTFVRRDLAELRANNVRVRIIGERSSLKSDILKLLIEAEETTRTNTGMTMVIAFNYGARDEMTRAVSALVRDVQAGLLPASAITPEAISARLDTAGIPDPDLIIRTSGEERLSNFLLWQAAYSELIFVPEYWPDFSRENFLATLELYASRNRRFGGLAPAAAVVAGS